MLSLEMMEKHSDPLVKHNNFPCLPVSSDPGALSGAIESVGHVAERASVRPLTRHDPNAGAFGYVRPTKVAGQFGPQSD